MIGLLIGAAILALVVIAQVRKGREEREMVKRWMAAREAEHAAIRQRIQQDGERIKREVARGSRLTDRRIPL